MLLRAAAMLALAAISALAASGLGAPPEGGVHAPLTSAQSTTPPPQQPSPQQPQTPQQPAQPAQPPAGVGGVRRFSQYSRGRGYRDWRTRGDPTLINSLWRSRQPLGIRKQLGNAEVYIVLALLIGFVTVVVGCWLSDNCWSPDPEERRASGDEGAVGADRPPPQRRLRSVLAACRKAATNAKHRGNGVPGYTNQLLPPEVLQHTFRLYTIRGACGGALSPEDVNDEEDDMEQTDAPTMALDTEETLTTQLTTLDSACSRCGGEADTTLLDMAGPSWDCGDCGQCGDCRALDDSSLTPPPPPPPRPPYSRQDAVVM